MPRSAFPGQIDLFTEHADQQQITPDHVNKLQDAVVALEQKVLELNDLVERQANVDLNSVTGGLADWTLMDAKAHADAPHGTSLASLVKATSYGIGLSAEDFLNRLAEDAHTHRNTLLLAKTFRTIKQPDNTYRVQWDQPMRVIYRSSNANNAHALTSIPASGFAITPGDVLYVQLPRDLADNSVVNVQKATLASIPFDPDGNQTLILGYFDGSELVLRNGTTSQLRDYQVAADAGINAKKISKDLHQVEGFNDQIAGDLDQILDSMFDTLIAVDRRVGTGLMNVIGGTFLGPVTFLPGGVYIAKGSDDNGALYFGDGSAAGTTRVRDTADGLEIRTSRRLDLNASQGVWIGGQNLRAPGLYDVAIADAVPLAAGAERSYPVTYGTGNTIPVFPVGITPAIALSDASNPGSPFFLMRISNATNTSCVITLKNLDGAPQAPDNVVRLTLLT